MSQTPWWKAILDNPRQVFLVAVLVLSYLGYDQAVPAERSERARKAVQEATDEIDRLKKIVDDIRRDQGTILRLAGAPQQ